MILILGLTLTTPPASAVPEKIEADVCVYAATPSGILAAIAAKREGHSVVIVEPSRWVGGMLGAGLKPMQDCPNYASTGGMTRELLPKLGASGEKLGARERQGLNPRTIREDFRELLEEHEIQVIFDHRVASCFMNGAEIQSAVLDRAPFGELACPVPEPEEAGALEISARIFIDASYEGDLMARAGVSYRVGREAKAEFGEERAGVRPPTEITPIDPFVEPGNPASGLLPLVERDHGKPLGAADGYVQAYNYRYYTTPDPEFRLPITPPEDYDPADFELVGRFVAHLTRPSRNQENLRNELVKICPGWMNHGEWNYHRDTLISMAPLGISHIYADGDYAAKAAVWKAHQDYLRGLFHFMRTDERVPAFYREELAEVGLDRRAHPDTEGWPHQLYLRVSRRMEGAYMITAHDVYNRTTVEDPIGLAQYGIDTYPARRFVIEEAGRRPRVAIEGNMFVGGAGGPTNVPYPIPYRAITPKQEECANLLVPVCFSASHLGYASARMEPVFMICGESAGIAASRAIQEDVAVQGIDWQPYLKALKEAGQKLRWEEN